jgi:hypothetical protein
VRMEKIKIIATDYTVCTDVDYYIKGESTYETLGCIYNKEIAEYIVKACNEYQAIKEENEKLKEQENYLFGVRGEYLRLIEQLGELRTTYHTKAIKLQQQRDELVETLEKLLDNSENIEDIYCSCTNEELVSDENVELCDYCKAEQLLQKIKGEK